jgi:hypothetical protein
MKFAEIATILMGRQPLAAFTYQSGFPICYKALLWNKLCKSEKKGLAAGGCGSLLKYPSKMC